MTISLILALATSSLPDGVAELERCQLRTDIRPSGGFTDPALVCEGERVRGLAVQWRPDGTITGISWRDYEDAQRGRVTRLLASGEIHFGAMDETRGKKWSQLYRGMSIYVFGQPAAIYVEKAKGEPRFVVHDGTGMAWHLEQAPSPKYSWNFKYRITAIDQSQQSPLPVGFDEANIIGVDLVRTRAFHLVARKHNYGPYAKVTAPAWRRVKSHVFDRNGRRCAVPNPELFRIKEGDEYEMIFRFAGDMEGLTRVLAQRCSKLDRTPLAEIRPVEPEPATTSQPLPSGAVRRPPQKSGLPKPAPTVPARD